MCAWKLYVFATPRQSDLIKHITTMDFNCLYKCGNYTAIPLKTNIPIQMQIEIEMHTDSVEKAAAE